MYRDHFNLKERPFTHAPGDRFYEANTGVRDAINRLQHALTARDAIAVVTGGPGVGKSTLAERALAALPERSLIARVDLRYGEPDEIYAAILLALGADPAGLLPVQALHALREFMARFVSEDRLLVLSLDIAGFTADLVRHLTRVANLSGEHDCRMNFLLMGPHPIHQQLDVPALIHLRQRIVFRHRVRPLTLMETEAYIRHHIEAAGGDASELMSGNVPAAVYCYVTGVPRLINTLLDATLSDAAIQKLERPDGALIKRTADGLGWKPMTPSQGTADSSQNKGIQPTRSNPSRSAAPKAPIPAVVDKAQSAGSRFDLQPASEATLQLRGNGGAAAGPTPQAAASAETRPPGATAPGTAETPKRPPALPAMNPDDTSATGMLRLQDLDDRFAETVFGNDIEQLRKKHAN